MCIAIVYLIYTLSSLLLSLCRINFCVLFAVIFATCVHLYLNSNDSEALYTVFCLLLAEVHAALAAVLYADKKSPLAAEQQFTIATLLDPHYADLSYVKDTKHWPPSLVTSLKKLINFQ